MYKRQAVSPGGAVPVLALIEEIVDWLGPLFESYGYLVIALAVMLERSILLGLIVPGDIILALGGIYAQQGDLSVVWVIVIGSVAAISSTIRARIPHPNRDRIFSTVSRLAPKK